MPPKETLNRWLTDIQTHFKRRNGVEVYLSDPKLTALHYFCMQLDSQALTKQPVEQTRFVVIDTETTGLQAYSGDEIISISLLEMQGLKFTGHKYETLIDPQRPIPPESTAIHGLQDSDVVGCPKITEILADLIYFIDEAVIIGHHIGFDLRFLNKTLKKQLLCELRHPWIDTMLLYTALRGQVGHYTLDEIAAICRIHNPARHTAHGDAIATGLIFQYLVKPLLLRNSRVTDLIEIQFEVGQF